MTNAFDLNLLPDELLFKIASHMNTNTLLALYLDARDNPSIRNYVNKELSRMLRSRACSDSEFMADIMRSGDLELIRNVVIPMLNKPNLDSCLLQAASRMEHKDVIELMIEKEATDWNGEIDSDRFGHKDVIQLMVDKGVTK